MIYLILYLLTIYLINESAGIPEISNCIIENSGAWGIYLDNTASPTLTNNSYANNASGDKNL